MTLSRSYSKQTDKPKEETKEHEKIKLIIERFRPTLRWNAKRHG